MTLSGTETLLKLSVEKIVLRLSVSDHNMIYFSEKSKFGGGSLTFKF